MCVIALWQACVVRHYKLQLNGCSVAAETGAELFFADKNFRQAVDNDNAR